MVHAAIRARGRDDFPVWWFQGKRAVATCFLSSSILHLCNLRVQAAGGSTVAAVGKSELVFTQGNVIWLVYFISTAVRISHTTCIAHYRAKCMLSFLCLGSGRWAWQSLSRVKVRIPVCLTRNVRMKRYSIDDWVHMQRQRWQNLATAVLSSYGTPQSIFSIAKCVSVCLVLLCLLLLPPRTDIRPLCELSAALIGHCLAGKVTSKLIV